MSGEEITNVCFNRIKVSDGLFVRYCGNCEIVPGTKVFLANEHYCD